MAESITEDVYALDQMKQYASDLYNRRKNEKPGTDDADKYAYHIGEAIHHLRDAISERIAEKENKVANTGFSLYAEEIIREVLDVHYGNYLPVGEDGNFLTQDYKAYVLSFDENGVLDVYQGGSE